MRKLFTLLFFMAVCHFAEGQCTLPTQVSTAGFTCAGTTAANNDNVTGGTIKYVSDQQHFGNYTLAGGTLVICAGGNLWVNNLNFNATSSIYIYPGGTLSIGNMGGQGRNITNYGTLSFDNGYNGATGDNIYNAGELLCNNSMNIQSSCAFANVTTTSTLQMATADINFNSAGFVNNGELFARNITFNGGGIICTGNNSSISCININGNQTGAITVDNSGAYTSCIYYTGNAQLNNNLGDGSNNLYVAAATGATVNNASLWGTTNVTLGSTGCGTAPSGSKVFFSKNSGNLELVGSWGNAPDGSGTNPTNFTSDGQVFIIKNRSTADITAASSWTVSGNNATIVIGDGINATNFNVGGGNFSISGNLILNPLGSITVASGKTAAFNSSNIWIRSNAKGDGSLGKITGSTTGLATANVFVDRFVPAKNAKKWSFLTVPLTTTNPINQGWQGQIHITGPITNGVICSDALSTHQVTSNTDNGLDPNSTGNYSIYSYNSSQAPGSSWQPLTNTLTTSPTQGIGYRVLVRGPRNLGCSLIGTDVISSADLSVTIRSKGNLQDITGGATTFSLPLSGANASNKYFLIGNPYPCSLNFTQFQSDNSSSITNNYWIFSPSNAAGTYFTYSAGVTANAPGGYTNPAYISSGQAFIVQTSLTSATLTFNEAQKSISPNQIGTFGLQTNGLLRTIMKDAAGNNLDEIVIRYSSNSTIKNNESGVFDAASLNSSAEQYIQSIKANNQLAIQTRAANFTRDTVNLNVVSKTAGKFQLDCSGFESFDNTDIYLIDKLTGNMQLMNANPTLQFSINTSDPNSFGANRFALVFALKSNTVSGNTINNIKVFPQPATNQVTVQLPGTDNVYNVRMLEITGRLVIQKTLSSGTNQISLSGMSKGMYLLEVTDSNGNRQIQKIVKQ